MFVSVSQSVVNAGKFSERSILAPCTGAMISLVCILAAVLDSLAPYPLNGIAAQAADTSTGDADAPQVVSAARHVVQQCAAVTGGARTCDAQQLMSHAGQELIQLPQELIQELILLHGVY